MDRTLFATTQVRGYGSRTKSGTTEIVQGATPPLSRHTAPEFCKFICPQIRGRREDRVRAAPAVSCAKAEKKTHTSIQVQRKQSGLPCAMVLTVSFVLSSVTGLLSPSPRGKFRET